MADAMRCRWRFAICSTWRGENVRETCRRRIIPSHFTHFEVAAEDDGGGNDEGDECVEAGVVNRIEVEESGKTSGQFRNEDIGSDSGDQRWNWEEEDDQPTDSQSNEDPSWIDNGAVVQRWGDRIETVTVQAAGRPHGHRVEQHEEDSLHRARPLPLTILQPIVGATGDGGQCEGKEEEAQQDIDEC